MNKSIVYKNPVKYEKNSVKIYQEWKGNNKFCFKGKIYIGSEYYYGLLTFFYLLINYFIYAIFIIKVSKSSFFLFQEI